MGCGIYSSAAREIRAIENGYHSKSTRDIFTERSLNSEMSPYGLDIRESRDSAEHPDSFPIIIALDVTGSMGSIPTYLVKKGLPDIMDKIIKSGIKDPQVLFLGIGDHEYDDAPLQVGQFESSDELLDHWLTKVYIEGGGGCNDGESYLLAWDIAARHTSTDAWEKRKKKGLCVTIGDEKTLKTVPLSEMKKLYGADHAGQSAAGADELFEAASEKWECFHINLSSTYSGKRDSVQSFWKQLCGDHCVIVDDKEKVADVIADLAIKTYGGARPETAGQVKEDNSAVKPTGVKPAAPDDGWDD